MASAPSLDGLTRLPHLDPEATALGAALVALLDAAGIDATIPREVPAGPWFACADDVAFRIDDPVPLAPERIGDAVALLDRAEPLLLALERALGIPLEPAGLDAEGEQPVVIAFPGGLLTLPASHPRAADWLAYAATLKPDAAALPVALAVLVHGPRLAVAEAGDLEPGDLVLIGPRPAATLEAADGASHAGQLDLASGQFTLHPQGAPMAAEPVRDFAVPLTLKLPDRATSAASLAALKPGMALPLGPLTDGMPVELLVAGRPLARGELIQLGDRFAVLIEERSALDDAAVTETVEIEGEAETTAEVPA